MALIARGAGTMLTACDVLRAYVTARTIVRDCACVTDWGTMSRSVVVTMQVSRISDDL